MSGTNHTKKKAKTVPPPPPPKRLYLGYKTSSSGGQRESDEPYSSRSPEYIEVTFTSLSRESGTFFGHNIEVTDEVYAADEVYLVVVRYRDGDSFGSSHGNWTVWAAVATEAEAIKIGRDIESGALHKDGHYLPWEGYFNSLEGVETHSFRVAEKPTDSNVSPKVSIHRH
jgi:hypothetical protein